MALFYSTLPMYKSDNQQYTNCRISKNSTTPDIPLNSLIQTILYLTKADLQQADLETENS